MKEGKSQCLLLNANVHAVCWAVFSLCAVADVTSEPSATPNASNGNMTYLSASTDTPAMSQVTSDHMRRLRDLEGLDERQLVAGTLITYVLCSVFCSYAHLLLLCSCW